MQTASGKLLQKHLEAALDHAKNMDSTITNMDSTITNIEQQATTALNGLKHKIKELEESRDAAVRERDALQYKVELAEAARDEAIRKLETVSACTVARPYLLEDTEVFAVNAQTGVIVHGKIGQRCTVLFGNTVTVYYTVAPRGEGGDKYTQQYQHDAVFTDVQEAAAYLRKPR